MIDETAEASAAGDSRKGFPNRLRVTDHFVPHISTVPVSAGQDVHIFVREKVLDDGKSEQRPAVLMVHGGISHGTLAFDLQYKTYSWMDELARSGFDVFAMDLTGYGRSARPEMDNPDNVDPKQRSTVLPNAAAPGEIAYPFQLVTIQSECDEIDRVVDFIRQTRGLAKVNLIGWSGGGARTGFYTGHHQEKVDRLVILAASNYVGNGPDTPPALPAPGFPMTVQSRRVAEVDRWNPFVRCEGQLDPGIQEVVWQASIDSDPLGASWGPGVMRAPTRTYWGWNRQAAARITVPTLIMVGEFDALLESNRELFGHLGATEKAFLNIACGSHFVVWETPHGTVQKFSREWLTHGTCGGNKHGIAWADMSGNLVQK